MINPKFLKKHDWIQAEILSAFHDLGIEAKPEYRGQDWRADVFVPNDGQSIAFEVQLSPQSLKRTLERQSKYLRDGITGCWLFENPVSKLNDERPDLPLFYVEEGSQQELLVNLGDRKKVELKFFLEIFIKNNIKFRNIAKTDTVQNVKLVFYPMECWKCKEINTLYYVDTVFYSACHAEIRPDETLWDSNKPEYIPEIIQLANKFAQERPDLNLKFGTIKERYSNTVQSSYTAFGCYKCNSIFGDWFIMEAKLEYKYVTDILSLQEEIEISKVYELDIPHWCFPENNHFCEKKEKNTLVNKT